jgi:uncharacterized membrane protein
MTEKLTKRIESIDRLRGIVMMLMALDHVRDYFYIGANTADPLDLETTFPMLFFTRWITHFCAPIFVLLSGTSIYLQSKRKTPKQLGLFVLTRGCWLIVAEWTIVAFGWTFNPGFPFVPFQVIWAIGISMVILGLLLLMRVSYPMLLGLGIVVVFGHNMLDSIEQAPGFEPNFWWDVLHHGRFEQYMITENHSVLLIYPFVPWTGIMLLGYGLGVFFTPAYSAALRAKILLTMGAVLFLFFVALRYSNMYGDPADWSSQKNILFTLFSFVNLQKYPPSLLYSCLTLSVALLLLVWLEKMQNRFSTIATVFGRTAFFYYILHLYVIHTLATLVFFARGHSFAEGTNSAFRFVVTGEGFELAGVYAVWALVLVVLYPICKWYDGYKQQHKEKWWLSYL